MTFTLTTRLGLPQWTQGADGPSRVQLNAAFAALDTKAAYDDGAVGAAALPSSDVVNGRYAPTVDGAYRKLYRRAGGTWTQVGGNTWGETTYHRGDPALPTTGQARQVSHPSLGTAGRTEYWDGASIASGRQSVGDLNPGLPGAVHVGDTTSTADLALRGRVYARTTADGHRGFVASAHAAGAGPLFTAREPGGTDPWLVDSQGRMRAQAPTAFGGGVLTAGVPISTAPGAADASGADFSAAGVKPALRVFRGAGDLIASYGTDSITLGKTGWTGGQIRATAPTITLDGAVTITGTLSLPNGTISAADLPGNLTVEQLTVTGQTSLAATTAGALTATTLAATNGVSAHGGLAGSAVVGSGAELRTRPPVQYSGTAQQSVRAPTVYHRSTRLDLVIPTSEVATQAAVVMGEDGWMRLDVDLFFISDVGAGGMETFKVATRVELLTNSGTVMRTSVAYANTATADSPERNKPGEQMCHITEVFPDRLAAGNYQIKLRMVRAGVLGGKLARATYTVMPVVLHSASYAST